MNAFVSKRHVGQAHVHPAPDEVAPGAFGSANVLAPVIDPIQTSAISWKSAVNGNWSTAADWSTGTVPGAGDDVTISVAGKYTVTINSAEAAHSLTLNDSSATVSDTGVFTVGTNLTITAGTFALASGGIIQGGTISVGTGNFSLGGGTLSGSTYEGTFAFAASNSLFIENGLTVTGAGGTGNGTISLAAGNDQLVVLDTEILNNATLTFGSGSNSYFELSGISSTQTVTLGSGFTVTQSGGSNYLSGYYDGPYYGSLTNAGLISVSGGTLTVGAAPNGDFLSNFLNTGTISISGGVFDINSGCSSLGSISTSGAGKFEIGSNGIVSGIINISGGGFIGGGGTLSAATWEGALTLSASNTLFIENGLTLTGAGGTGSGTISLAAGNDQLVVLDTEILNNATLTFGSGSNSYFELSGISSTQTVTLGSGFTVTQSGGSNYLSGYYDGPYYGSLTNAGLISVSGGTLTVGAAPNGDFLSNFLNTGTISISGGVFDINSGCSSLGSISTSGAGKFEIGSNGIVSGIINISGGGFIGGGGTLSAATWEGALTLSASNTLFIENGLTLTGAGGTGSGTISLAAGNDQLVVLDTEILNNATLTFGSGSNSYFELSGISSTQTVTLGSGFTVTQSGGSNYLSGYYDGPYYGSLTNAGLISVSGGTLTVGAAPNGDFLSNFLNTGTISISGGVFDINSGCSSLGSISTSGAGKFEIGSSGIVSGIVNISGGGFIGGGGTLNAATWEGALTLSASNTLFIENGLTLTGAGGTGNGTISLAAGNDQLVVLDTETLNNATFTFGSGSNSYFYVDGASSAQTVTLGSGFTVTQAGGSNYLAGDYDIYYGSLVNSGLISVSGGTLTAEYLTNFTNAGTILISGGNFNVGNGSGGIFTNSGSISISGGVFDLTESMVSVGNIATSGTGVFEIGSYGILSGTINDASAKFSFGGGTLSAATWEGALTLSAGNTLFIENGLTLTGAGGTGSGTISLAAGNDQLVVLDTETLNNATFTFGSGSNSYFYVDGASSAQTVTLGSGFTVTQAGGSSYLAGDYDIYYGSLVNSGLISVSGGTLTAEYLTNFTNAGTILISGGNFNVGNGSGGIFTNSGSISISGGVFDLTESMVSVGNIATSGTGVFEIGSYGILSGTINDASAKFSFGGGTLSAATWQGALTLAASNTLFIENGLTLTGAGGSGAGTISMSAGNDSLIVLDSETLNNATLSFGGGTGSALWVNGTTNTQTVTLGAAFTVTQTGGTNYLSGDYDGPYLGSLTNAGLISVSGGTLSIGGDGGSLTSFSNIGTISVTGGTINATTTTISNLKSGTLTAGTYSVGASGTLALLGSAGGTTDAAVIILSGAKSVLEFYNSNAGTYTTLDQKLVTIASTGTLELLAGRNFTASAAFTDNGLLQLGGTNFTAASGLALSSNGTLLGYGTLAGPLTDAGTVAASGGTLLLSGAVTGSGALSAAAGATVDLTTGGALTEAISGAGTLQLDGTNAYSFAGGTNAIGLTKIDAGVGLSAAGTFTGSLADAGTLTASGATLLIDGAVTITGALVAGAGVTIDLAGGGTVTGAVSGAGTLQLDGSNALVLQSPAALGVGAVVVDAGATLGLTEGGSLAGSITGAGTLALQQGAYTIATTIGIGNVAVGAGASVSGTGTIQGSVADNGSIAANGGTLTIAGTITGAGVLTAAAGSVLNLTGGGTITETISGAGVAQLAGAYALAGGTETIAALIVETGAALTGFGSLTAAITDAGTITASGGTLTLSGAVTGAGGLVAASGAVVDLAGGGALTEAISGAGTLQLDAATYTVAAATFAVATVAVDAGAAVSGSGTIAGVLADAGTVTANGGTLVLANVTGGGTISANAGAVLDLTAATVLTETIGGAGTLQLDNATDTLAGGTVGIASLTVDAGATLSGYGTIASAIADAGAIVANAGTLVLSGAVTGAGGLAANASAVLNLTDGGALTQAISGSGTLQLDNGAYTLAGGTVAVATVVVDAGAMLSGFGTVAGALIDTGTVSATSSTLVLGAVSGAGTLAAASGAVLDLTVGSALTEQVTGSGTLQLDGGTYTLGSTALGIANVIVDSTAALGGPGTVNGALVNLGSMFTATGTLMVEGAISGTGSFIAGSGATLDFLGGGLLAGAFSGAGSVQLDDAAYTLQAGEQILAATTVVDAGASLSGAGTLANALVDNGAVAASAGGTLVFFGPVSGAGTLSAAAGALLDFKSGATLSETISGAGTLELEGAASYTLAGGTLAIGTVAVATGATLSGFGTIDGAVIDNGTIVAAGGTLTLQNAITGGGALQVAANATLDLAAGGALNTAVSGAGTLELNGAYTLGTGALTMADLLIGPGGSLSGAGTFSIATTNDGTLAASGGTLTLKTAVAGGELAADGGSTLLLLEAGSFGGTLAGAGTIDIASALVLANGATLAGADMIETVSITLAASAAVSESSGATLNIDALAKKTVEISGPSSTHLTNGGSLIADGAGTAKIGTSFINSGIASVSSGTLSFLDAVTNNGTLDAGAGVVTSAKAIVGTGTLEIGATGTLSLLLGAAAGQTVDFLAGTGLLDLTKPADFLGTISGFGGSDVIDLFKTVETTFTYSGGVLTVKDGTKTEATLHFAGSYSQTDFSLGTDGHSGTLIKFV